MLLEIRIPLLPPVQKFEVPDVKKNYLHDEPFCCMMWLKMVFMAGFTLSQFSIGYFCDAIGLWRCLRISIKSLIICGMITYNAGKINN